jgi:hypothetical protein
MDIKLSTIKANPDNPRNIKDIRFWYLLRSIFEFPKGLVVRPIVIDEKKMTLGGNMRLRTLEYIVKNGCQKVIDKIIAETTNEDSKIEEIKVKLQIQALKVWEDIIAAKAIPSNWVATAEGFTEEEIERFIVIDNVGFGQWDYDLIANKNFKYQDQWTSWGFEEQKFEEEEEKKEPAEERDGSKLPFSFKEEQLQLIGNAIDKALLSEEFKYVETFGNTDGNANALYLIVSQYLSGVPF